ncbi:hypothetical protein ACQP3J_30520, partial [Escherichia coli]
KTVNHKNKNGTHRFGPPLLMDSDSLQFVGGYCFAFHSDPSLLGQVCKKKKNITISTVKVFILFFSNDRFLVSIE